MSMCCNIVLALDCVLPLENALQNIQWADVGWE